MCTRLHHSQSAFIPGCVVIAAGLLVVSPARADWGLIGYWAMDENGGTVVNDTHDPSEPNNHDGTVSNAVWKSGHHGSALEFPKETESAMVTGIAQAFNDAADGASLTVSAHIVNTVVNQTPCINCYLNKSDTEGSGAVDGQDIKPFIDLLIDRLPQ